MHARRAQHFAVPAISTARLISYCARLERDSRSAGAGLKRAYRFVKYGVELLAHALDGCYALLFERFRQPFVNGAQALGHRVGRLIDVFERAVEIVHHVKKREDDGALAGTLRRPTLTLDALAVVVEIGQRAHPQLALAVQIVLDVLNLSRC